MNKALFFHQFAALLKAGFSVAKSLAMASEKSPAPVQSYLQQASQRIDRGTSLAIALKSRQSVFTPWELGLLNLGETSGALIEVSQRLGHQCEVYRRRARLYGSVLVSFGVIGGVVVIVLGAWLIGGLAALNSPVVWGLAGALAIALLFQTQVPLQINLGDRGHTWLRQIPVFQTVIEARSLTQLAELAIPIRCGLPMPQALALVVPRLADPQLARVISQSIRQVDRGESLSGCLQGTLPPTAVQMIRTGEETGQLDTLLDKLGEHYDGELERSLRQLEGMARPLALLAVGVLIGLIGVQMVV
ncbi:MAG: type II secretion system F family protein, partial [Cyanobacteria bacterium J06659_2]